MGLIVSHSWEQQQTVLIPTFIQILEEHKINYSFIKNEHRLDLPWASVIFRTGSKPIVGHTVGWAWIDEAALCPDSTWKDVLARCRDPQAKQMQILLTSTPEGRRGFLYEHFKASPLPNSRLIYGSTTENKHLHPAYLESLTNAYDEQFQKAYIHGQFTDFSANPAYHSYSHTLLAESWRVQTIYGNYELMDLNENQTVWISCDFGNHVSTCVIAQEGTVNNVHCVRIIDEVYLKDANTWDLAHAIVEKYKGKELIVRVTGDSTGQHMRGSAATQTDYDVLRRILMPNFQRYNLDIPSQNSREIDRVETANSAFKGSKKFQLKSILGVLI